MSFPKAYGVLRGEGRLARSRVKGARSARTFLISQGRKASHKLHVYAVALELHALCAVLAEGLHHILRDQLERASLSIVLNVAEGGGRRSRRDKARFYVIARGSATEVAALLDVLAVRGLAPAASIADGRRFAIRVVQMLTRLDQRLAGR